MGWNSYLYANLTGYQTEGTVSAQNYYVSPVQGPPGQQVQFYQYQGLGGLGSLYAQPQQVIPRHSAEYLRRVHAFYNRSQTGFGDYEERHKSASTELLEDEGMKEGFTGMLNTFLVGCDPEFVALSQTGEQINLSRYLPDNGEVGYDHGGRVGELRPEATRGTYALTKRLQRLIKSTVLAGVPAAKLRAGARVGRDTIGGHVHLGFPVPRGGDSKIQALDRFTQVLEELDILPKAESEARRGAGNYGRFGDVRDCRGHLEYRTMASWLVDPRVAYLCLTGAKLAACDSTGTVESLPRAASFNELIEWFRRYRTKDINARRALERVLSLGHRALQVYPDVDFRERWRELGL
jgi:hypothetical protein